MAVVVGFQVPIVSLPAVGKQLGGDDCKEEIASQTKQGGFAISQNSRRAKLAARGVVGFEIRVEAVLKPWITSEGKAPHGLKAERTRQYVSISSRGATAYSSLWK